MAWRIEENVVRGEIDNQTPGQVSGKIWLAGRETPLVLSLSGNGHRDLAGCKLTFSNPAPKPDSTIKLNPDQTGVVGDITAARKVRVIENLDHQALSEDRPYQEHIANCLYLEWFSETNGRVVIESTDYEISVGEPAWRLNPEEEARQHQANAEAMQSFMERLSESFDAREEAAYHGEPKNEFEWELFLRASDRRSTKLGELLEKYKDNPERDRLVAQGMGWTWIEEMLDAKGESSGEADEEQKEGIEFEEYEHYEENDLPARDPVRHPLVTRLINRSVELSRLAEDLRDEDLEEMVGSFMMVGPKVAGALTIGDQPLSRELDMSGLVVAKLKRAVGELSQALNAANRLRDAKRELPFSLDEWITEILETRQAILTLMDEFRRRED